MADHDQNDVLRVDVLGLYDNTDLIVNTYQFRLAGATTVNDAQLLQDLDAVVNSIYTIAKALMTAAMIWRAFRTTNLTIDYFMGEESLLSTIAGTSSGDSLPPGVAALMYTGVGLPHVQLRKYFGPVSETFCTATGRFGGSYVSIMEDIADQLDSNIVGTYQQFEYGYRDPDTGTFYPPAAISYSLIPAYQRRRKQGKGA